LDHLVSISCLRIPTFPALTSRPAQPQPGTIPTASKLMKPSEKPLAARRIAPEAERMHPISKNRSFILSAILHLTDGYFHFVSISSLRNVALEAKESSTSTTTKAATIISRLLVPPRSIRFSSPETYSPANGRMVRAPSCCAAPLGQLEDSRLPSKDGGLHSRG
jgi:hypothetical protein